MKKSYILSLLVGLILLSNTNTDAKELNKMNFKTFTQLTDEIIKEKEKAIKEEIDRQLEAEKIRKNSVNFNSMDVTELSNLKVNELEDILNSNNEWQGLTSYAKYFIEAEELYNINALFICAIAAQESGWGKRPAGDGTNLTGYAVYTSSSNGTTFNSIRHNILATTELIANEYVNPNGKYHTVWNDYNNGKSIYEINVKYCLKQDMKTTDFNWSNSIYKIANSLLNAYKKQLVTLN